MKRSSVTTNVGTREGSHGLGTSIGIGVLFGYVLTGGLTNAGEGGTALILAGIVVGGVLGLLAGVGQGKDWWRSTLLGFIGASTFVVAVFALLLFAIIGTDFCLS